jgi:hypothetical protein
MKLHPITEDTHLIDLWNTMRLEKIPFKAGALPIWAFRQLAAAPDLLRSLKRVAAGFPKEYSVDRSYQVEISGKAIEQIYDLLNEFNKAEYIQEKARKPHRLAAK